MSRTVILFCRLLGLGVACTAVILSGTSVQGQAPVTLEAIAKAWQERQDRVRSARFTWTERETIPKGHLTDLVGSLGREAPERLREMGIPPGSVIPPEDTTHNVPSSLCLDGEKLRYMREDRQWSAKEKAYVAEPRLTVFDGKVGKTFYPTGASYTPWPQGLIRRSYPDAGSLYLSPLVMTLRAFLPQMHLFHIETMTLTGRKAVIDGKSCLELERLFGTFAQRAWVDPSRGYVIVRLLSTSNEQPRSKVDIGYRKDVDAGWVPETWDIFTYHSNGKLERSTRAKVTSYQVNLAVESAEFDIKFPPGTRVHDDRDPKAPVDYIIKEDEKKRMILPEDIGATYEQMLNSEPGEALGKRKHSFLSWPVVLVTVVLVVTGGLLLWKRGVFGKRLT